MSNGLATPTSSSCSTTTSSPRPSSSNGRVVSDLGKRLLEAARLGDTEEVSSLMGNGAPLTTDWLGTTPLHLASIYGHTATAELLVRSGISRDGRTKVDKVPLHFACQYGHFEIVKLLVNGGAHINAADMLKMTPLHWAVEANNYQICLFLLKAGVKTCLQNKFDKTPLQIAKEKCYLQLVELLGDVKFKVEKVTEENADVPCAQRKPKTKRFPMLAGTWAGGEAQMHERLEVNEPRKRAVGIRRKSSQKPDDRPAFLASSTVTSNECVKENSLTSLVSAAKTLLQNRAFVENNTEPGRTTTTLVTSPSTSVVTTSASTQQHAIYLPNSNIRIPLQMPNEIACKESIDPNLLHHGIPVITSQAMSMLPPNIQAVPLDKAVPAEDPVVPVNIPLSLLTQIIDSGVTIQARQNAVASSPDFVAINTAMGTIPIMPSNSGVGGLQLISMGERQMLNSPLLLPCSLGAANLSMLAARNGGFDVANAFLEDRNPATVPRMLLPGQPLVHPFLHSSGQHANVIRPAMFPAYPNTCLQKPAYIPHYGHPFFVQSFQQPAMLHQPHYIYIDQPQMPIPVVGSKSTAEIKVSEHSTSIAQ